MVEAGLHDLTDVPTPRPLMCAGMPWKWRALVNQEVEARIEQVKRQFAPGLKMAMNGFQRFSL